jgi:hypothetical protein
VEICLELVYGLWRRCGRVTLATFRSPCGDPGPASRPSNLGAASLSGRSLRNVRSIIYHRSTGGASGVAHSGARLIRGARPLRARPLRHGRWLLLPNTPGCGGMGRHSIQPRPRWRHSTSATAEVAPLTDRRPERPHPRPRRYSQERPWVLLPNTPGRSGMQPLAARGGADRPGSDPPGPSRAVFGPKWPAVAPSEVRSGGHYAVGGSKWPAITPSGAGYPCERAWWIGRSA